MAKPYAILSDLHCHAWSQFSTTNENGVNSRLQVILDEVERAAAELKERGGNVIYIAGDIFHVRGKMQPSVLNPVLDTFEKLTKAGFEIHAIPGNHDLENKESDALGNACRSLVGVGVHVYDKTTLVNDHMFMIPWQSSLDKLRDLGKYIGEEGHDCIIHAPLNGVIMGIPDHGLDYKEVAEWGCKRVFAGHYHNHKNFDFGVYSIGATTHQTWSDVNAKAGYLIVDGDDVDWRSSHAPKFIDVTGEEEDDLPFIVEGNYVRVKLGDGDHETIEKIRSELLEMGAKGVIVNAVRKPEVTRSSATVKTGETIEASVESYIKDKKLSKEVSLRAQEILAEVKAEA